MRLLLLILLLCYQSVSLTAQNDFFSALRQGNIKAADSMLIRDPKLINMDSPSGYSPLMIAVYNNQPEVCKLLIKSGANINQNSPQGSALHASIHKKLISLSKWLITNGIDVNLVDGNNQSALIFAVLNNQVELVQFLLEHGANPKIRDQSNLNALDYAKELKLLKIIHLLENQ